MNTDEPHDRDPHKQDYAAGDFLAGWLKVKRWETADLVVGGYVGPRDAPSSLLLGAYDEKGALRYVGRTLHPSRLQIQAVADRLRGLERSSSAFIAGRVPGRSRGIIDLSVSHTALVSQPVSVNCHFSCAAHRDDLALATFDHFDHVVATGQGGTPAPEELDDVALGQHSQHVGIQV